MSFFGKKEDSMTRGWKEKEPVFIGMFARGCYPTDSGFFMTYRFDLAEPVNAEVIEAAWNKTLINYPFMACAVVKRRRQYVYTENPLPFVIKETEEVIQPFEKEGNYHMVTFCYKGSTLWVYVDHIPVDGTGANRLFETFFYNYYCILDKRNYAKPEGVFTEEDGVVEGHDEDLYKLIEPVKLKGATNGMMGQKGDFILPEWERADGKIFLDRKDCRGYCISIPSDEFMTYARSIKGSPTSVLAVMYARTFQTLYPSNTKPYRIGWPVSIRNIMGVPNTLLLGVTHFSHCFDPAELLDPEKDMKLNADFRAEMKRTDMAETAKKLAGVNRSIAEMFIKAARFGLLNFIAKNGRKSASSSLIVSYIGTLRTSEYGSRIKMTAFHVMPEKGIMIQMTEVGGTFYMDWYQGFEDDKYVRTMTELLQKAGMKRASFERIE